MAVNYHTSTRIPIDDKYAVILGKAVYAFAYYEWIIIYILEYLDEGFVNRYSRGNPMPSGAVAVQLSDIIGRANLPSSVTRVELEQCALSFGKLKEQRNALIHAHPITSNDGEQILSYQSKTTKLISDKIWPIAEIESFVCEIDEAAIFASGILDRIRK
jgi:hypothetical protein